MFEKMTLEKYNEVLASKAPTPGGGSALAVVGSVACSLVEMSVNVTLAKISEQDDTYQYLQTNVGFFSRARSRFYKLADDDAQVFQNIIDCNHLPKDTPDAQLHRQNQLQKAYHKAALVPLDVMNLCKEALNIAKNRIYPLLYKYVASDCKIGIDLFCAIIENSMENVYANTNLITDKTLKETLENRGRALISEAKNL